MCGTDSTQVPYAEFVEFKCVISLLLAIRYTLLLLLLEQCSLDVCFIDRMKMEGFTWIQLMSWIAQPAGM